MSNEAITWAFKQDLPMNEKFVLVALADYADENFTCYPSYAKTAERVNCHRTTVIKLIKKLVGRGVLEIISSSSGRSSNRYKIVLDWAERSQIATSSESLLVADYYLCGSPGATSVVARSLPYPSYNPHITNRSQEPEAKASEDKSSVAKEKPIQQQVTEWVYDKTNGSINFKAVMGCVKYHLQRNREPALVANACIALYEAGKPITNQTLGQAMDGKIRGVVVNAPRKFKDSSEPTREEVDKLLGMDKWRIPSPPEDLPVEQILTWESDQKKKHWEERKAQYLERIGNGK